MAEASASAGPKRPNRTPTRTFRVPDPIYERAQARATQRGDNLSEIVRRALDRYGKKKP